MKPSSPVLPAGCDVRPTPAFLKDRPAPRAVHQGRKGDRFTAARRRSRDRRGRANAVIWRSGGGSPGASRPAKPIAHIPPKSIAENSGDDAADQRGTADVDQTRRIENAAGMWGLRPNAEANACAENRFAQEMNEASEPVESRAVVHRVRSISDQSSWKRR